MKANELMVGDLVCLKDDTKCELPLKVDGVLTDDISLEGEGFLGGVEGLIRLIPLTSEILEKNGWEEKAPTQYRHNCCICIDILDDSCYCVYNYFDSFPYCKINLTIHYVHELQHALRLCGLNELADNFKL